MALEKRMTVIMGKKIIIIQWRETTAQLRDKESLLYIKKFYTGRNGDGVSEEMHLKEKDAFIMSGEQDAPEKTFSLCFT